TDGPAIATVAGASPGTAVATATGMTAAPAACRATRRRRPSCSTSISLRPNSSSKAVSSRIASSSIAILRSEPSCDLGATASALGRCADHGGKPADCECVAADAEAADHRARGLRNIGIVAEALARVDVGDVDLDHRNAGREDGVEDRDRGGGVAPRIEHDAHRLLARLLDPIDQRALVIRLAKLDPKAEALGRLAAQPLDVGKRGVSVFFRLAGP